MGSRHLAELFRQRRYTMRKGSDLGTLYAVLIVYYPASHFAITVDIVDIIIDS